jgi:hypothetical protein
VARVVIENLLLVKDVLVFGELRFVEESVVEEVEAVAKAK